MAFKIPAVVRERALANPTAGHRWLDTLPDVIADLAKQWQITVGAPFAGGTAAFVAAATHADGSPCVLKVAMPLDMHEADSFARSVTAHQIANGSGCVALLAHDEEHSALLLEPLGKNLNELNFSVDQILRTVATTLVSFWQPVGLDCGLPTGAEGAAWLANFVVATWESLDRPCDKRVIDQAVAFCDERAAAFDPSTAVLVHGDAHGWNTLAVGDGTFKLVDPEGLASEPGQDLAVPMREYNEPLAAGDTVQLVRERAELLSELCDVDPHVIWQWGYIERVSTGLANLRDFSDGSGELFLHVAASCVDE